MKKYLLPAIFVLVWMLSSHKLWAQGSVTFTGPEILGRPTDESVTVNVVADAVLEAYFDYDAVTGGGGDGYDYQTAIASSAADEPIEAVMDGLDANRRYYYRMVYREIGDTEWIARDEHSFQTQRAPGSTFTFTIISDSHLGQYGGQTADELALYTQTLQNVQDDHPDFHLDLGDTFAMDPSPLGTGMTEAEADAAYFVQRPYLGQICHSIPFLFILGNHENEEGWNWDDVFTPPDQSLAIVGIKARKKYYPNPIPDAFYSGNSNPLPPEIGPIGGDSYREDYYAWEWGDALLVVIEPYHYSMIWPSEGGTYGGEGQDGEAGGDRWDWTLGIEQYLWLKETLENSNAKFKFVFSHHVCGGNNPYGRGGIIAAPYFEWGGKNADGSWGWDTERPYTEDEPWDVPIHDLMVANGVQIYFHGHDHEYVYETLDDIVYLECPKPDDAGYTWQPYSYGHNEGHYPDGLEIENSGHIRVQVSPEQVDVAYVRSYLPGDGTNKTIAHSFTIDAPYTGPTHDLTMAVAPSESGTTTPSIGTHTYPENRDVTITATPATGYLFDHWTGDVADAYSATTTVTMDEDKTVTAHFTVAPTFELTMAVDPTNGGTTNPAVGSHSYSQNTVVSITATPTGGYLFDHWEGDVADVNSATTTVTITEDKAVTAHFYQPPPGVIVYMGEIGAATSKTSGTSLVINTTTAVAAGDAIIVGLATDPYQNLGVTVTDGAGNTYTETAISICYQHVRTYIYAAYNVTALPAGSAITITLSNSITAKAAVATVFHGLALADPLDQSLGNPVAGAQQSISGATPSVGPTGTTAQPDEVLIGVIGTEGPVEDNAGTWDHAFSAGPRAGTTGSTAETNMTVCLGYRSVAATGGYTAQKRGITSRYWGAIISTFKAEAPPIAVELSACHARRLDNGAVAIDWTTQMEVKTAGFFVQRSEDQQSGFARCHDQIIMAKGGDAHGASYRFIDENSPERGCYYRLEEVALDGSRSFTEPVPLSLIAVTESEIQTPVTFALLQNYPNPFNPTTRIDYSISTSGPVTLDLFNLQGRLVKKLVEERQNSGHYSVTWDGTDHNGHQVVSGSYLYRLSSGDQTAVRKMVFLR